MKVGEGDDRGWDGCMASLAQWTWVWANSEVVTVREAWYATVMESQRGRHSNWTTKFPWEQPLRPMSTNYSALVLLTFNPVQFSHSAMSDSSLTHELLHARTPCPSPTPRVHWLSDAIQPSHPLSSPSPPAPNPSQHQSFPVSQLITSGGQSIGVSASASALPMNIQDWFPLGWTGWISLQSKGLSRVFSNSTVPKHQLWTHPISAEGSVQRVCFAW